MLKPKARNITVGLWTDEKSFLEASKALVQAGYTEIEAVTPYPVHHMDRALGLKRSSLPWVTFIFGLFGFSFGVWFTWWTSASNWALNSGGKPMWSLAAFIPIIFELTILFAALSSVAALIIACGLPKWDPEIVDPALSSHKFALMVYENDNQYDVEKIKNFFKQKKAEETREAKF